MKIGGQNLATVHTCLLIHSSFWHIWHIPHAKFENQDCQGSGATDFWFPPVYPLHMTCHQNAFCQCYQLKAFTQNLWASVFFDSCLRCQPATTLSPLFFLEKRLLFLGCILPSLKKLNSGTEFSFCNLCRPPWRNTIWIQSEYNEWNTNSFIQFQLIN